jgi:cell division protein FtsB
MTKHDLGLPSDSKAITYQQNREIERLKAENELIRQENKLLLKKLSKGT